MGYSPVDLKAGRGRRLAGGRDLSHTLHGHTEATSRASEVVVDELRIVAGWLQRTRARARWVHLDAPMNTPAALEAVWARYPRAGRQHDHACLPVWAGQSWSYLDASVARLVAAASSTASVSLRQRAGRWPPCRPGALATPESPRPPRSGQRPAPSATTRRPPCHCR